MKVLKLLTMAACQQSQCTVDNIMKVLKAYGAPGSVQSDVDSVDTQLVPETVLGTLRAVFRVSRFLLLLLFGDLRLNCLVRGVGGSVGGSEVGRSCSKDGRAMSKHLLASTKTTVAVGCESSFSFQRGEKCCR